MHFARSVQILKVTYARKIDEKRGKTLIMKILSRRCYKSFQERFNKRKFRDFDYRGIYSFSIDFLNCNYDGDHYIARV